MHATARVARGPGRGQPRRVAGLALAVLLLAGNAAAEPAAHGSAAVGAELLGTGLAGHDRLRLTAALAYAPPRWQRRGVVVALRQLSLDDASPRRAVLTGGLTFEAGAARPRLALALYADAGVALGPTAPVAGGGLRVTSQLLGPLAVVVDVGGHLVVDVGAGDLHLALGAALLVGVAR